MDEFPFRVTAAKEASDEDIKAAKMAELVLRHEWENNPKMREAYEKAHQKAVDAIVRKALYGF